MDKWSMEDVIDAHLVLNMMQKAQAKASEGLKKGRRK